MKSHRVYLHYDPMHTQSKSVSQSMVTSGQSWEVFIRGVEQSLGVFSTRSFHCWLAATIPSGLIVSVSSVILTTTVVSLVMVLLSVVSALLKIISRSHDVNHWSRYSTSSCRISTSSLSRETSLFSWASFLRIVPLVLIHLLLALHSHLE